MMMDLVRMLIIIISISQNIDEISLIVSEDEFNSQYTKASNGYVQRNANKKVKLRELRWSHLGIIV